MFHGIHLGICVVVLVCQTTLDGNELSKFLTPGGKLRAPLVFRDAQQGFVGVSGKVWTIEAGGHFSIARFLNEKTDPPYWEGDLTPLDIERVAKVLSASKFLELPDSFGRESKVNAHLLTLTFGKKKSELVLQAGETVTEETAPPAGDPQAIAWRNFISVVRAIQALAKDRKVDSRSTTEYRRDLASREGVQGNRAFRLGTSGSVTLRSRRLRPCGFAPMFPQSRCNGNGLAQESSWLSATAEKKNWLQR